MVAVVHESAGHRVTRGFLGCPACDARFPIEAGVVRLIREGVREGEPAPRIAPLAFPGPASDEAATLVGAVLDLAQGSGYVLLGPGLARIADAVGSLARRWEVVSLVFARPEETRGSNNVSRLMVSAVDRLPVLHGRFGAAALASDPEADRVREVAAALGPLGRLAIVTPGREAVHTMREAGLEVIAADERVAVASRRS
jgi:SAM-dependent methyltransferase